jgi:monoterpene epsilon-lactone hydrolase
LTYVKHHADHEINKGTTMRSPILIAWLLLFGLIGGQSGAQTTGSDVDASAIPVPQAISPEAQAYYASLKPRRGGTVDVRNEKALGFMRNFLAKIFISNVERLGITYELEQAPVEDAEAYWIRVSEVDEHQKKALIYLHGGGHILGSAHTNLAIPLRVSIASGIPVISVEYRLAPEHPFPADLLDSLATYRWLLDNGYAAENIGIFGDSSGGGLAVGLPLLARDEGLDLPAAIAALSPSVDHVRRGDTHVTLSDFDPILGPLVTDVEDVYAGTTPLTNPLLSPIYADFQGLPPLLIQVGTRERLLSDAVMLARRAREAGVDVTLDVWEGMWHVWQDHPTIPEAGQASQAIADFFTLHL